MGGLYLLQRDGETLEMVASHQLPQECVGAVVRRGEGIAGLVVETGQTMNVADYRECAELPAVCQHATFRRVLSVPIKSGADVIGVICLTDDTQVGVFGEEEVRLVSLFADQASIAIRNARLNEAVQCELVDRRRAEEGSNATSRHPLAQSGHRRGILRPDPESVLRPSVRSSPSLLMCPRHRSHCWTRAARR